MFVVWVSGNGFRCAARTLTQAIRNVPTQAKTGLEWATRPKPGLEWATRPCGVSQKMKQKGIPPFAQMQRVGTETGQSTWVGERCGGRAWATSSHRDTSSW